MIRCAGFHFRRESCNPSRKAVPEWPSQSITNLAVIQPPKTRAKSQLPMHIRARTPDNARTKPGRRHGQWNGSAPADARDGLQPKDAEPLGAAERDETEPAGGWAGRAAAPAASATDKSAGCGRG